jgi:two-component system chemotaxis sensor kinase CheA
VVHSNARGSVGLIVDQILDIIEDTFVLQRPASRPGVLGSAVLQGRVTELLDMDGVVRQLDPVMAAAAASGPLGAALEEMQGEAA